MTSMIGNALAPKGSAPNEPTKKAPGVARATVAGGSAPSVRLLPEEQFLGLLCLERKRTERSHRSFVLMLLSAPSLLRAPYPGGALDRVVAALSRSTRETDVKGWYRQGALVGVIFTEIGPEAEGHAVANALLAKINGALSSVLPIEEINEINLSFHVFPDDWEGKEPGNPIDLALYPERWEDTGARKTARLVKRIIDVAGSLGALIVLAPLLLLIAALIKLTSRGPVLFCQERLGHRGAPFRFLKFRSMYVRNSEGIHRDYMRNFISGAASAKKAEPVYKLTTDPRVTPLGRFLRKMSLDELPQFYNVLKGEMSLVGPRPPLRYEAACYDVWHRDRLLAAPPGITGLWQVEGRSRVTFDEAVRLDLQYANSWSLWLDFKILLRTPRAVLMGEGAY